MPTVNKTITTTAELICAPREKGWLVDLLVQNLSGNNVYIGTGDTVTADNGVKITPNGSYVNDHRRQPVYLIADAVGSDVRIDYEDFKEGSW